MALKNVSRREVNQDQPTTLFGYAIKESEDGLVITLQGVLAGDFARYLRSEISRGRVWPALARLGPISRFSALASVPVALTPSETDGVGCEGHRPDLKQIFSQSVTRGFDSFQRELEEFKVKLGEQSKRTSGGENSPRRAKRSSRRKTTKG